MKANSSLYGIGYHYLTPCKRRVVCCPPKNGCSILKFSILQATNPELCGAVLNTPSIVHRYTHIINIKSFHDTEDFDLYFVSRNPFSRVISAFVSKFIYFPEDRITRCITEIAELSAMDITFRQFVLTLCTLPDHFLDPHFVSQSCFLCDDHSNYKIISLDGVGKLSYSSFLDSISINSDLFSKAETNEEYKLRTISDNPDLLNREIGSLVDIPVKKLRDMWINGISMNKKSFESKDLRKLILSRYNHDNKLNELALNTKE